MKLTFTLELVWLDCVHTPLKYLEKLDFQVLSQVIVTFFTLVTRYL